MSFVVSIPEGNSMAGLIPVYDSPDLFKAAKIALLFAAKAVLTATDLSRANIGVLSVAKKIISSESYREDSAKMLVCCGIAFGAFEDASEPFILSPDIEARLILLINDVLNDIDLIKLVFGE